MLQEMHEIVEYLKENYRACVELCGKDDDVNTIPAKKMYQKALKIYTDMSMNYLRKAENREMKNYDALKQMPIRSFVNMVFNVVKHECQTEEDFVDFLEEEIPAELEGTAKEALQKLQHPSLN